MIARGDHDDIMYYVSHYSLCEIAQLVLIRRGDHEEIMAYISRNYLYEQSLLGLIKRGNHDEIMAYLKCGYPLCEEARNALRDLDIPTP